MTYTTCHTCESRTYPYKHTLREWFEEKLFLSSPAAMICFGVSLWKEISWKNVTPQVMHVTPENLLSACKVADM